MSTGLLVMCDGEIWGFVHVSSTATKGADQVRRELKERMLAADLEGREGRAEPIKVVEVPVRPHNAMVRAIAGEISLEEAVHS